MNGSPTCTAPRCCFGGFLGQILRRERRARQAVATGGRADVKHRIADAPGRSARDLFMSQHAEAEGVHERIALVALSK